ncbi:hypothetical protein QR685DRAFT_514968 [Neurospora intermedia]|uniref:Uncharacterized protein n=1 Tax=Neurospora intermedia TaxID=5142 RepID=A0ABR3DLC4_NEUIN
MQDEAQQVTLLLGVSTSGDFYSFSPCLSCLCSGDFCDRDQILSTFQFLISSSPTLMDERMGRCRVPGRAPTHLAGVHVGRAATSVQFSVAMGSCLRPTFMQSKHLRPTRHFPCVFVAVAFNSFNSQPRQPSGLDAQSESSPSPRRIHSPCALFTVLGGYLYLPQRTVSLLKHCSDRLRGLTSSTSSYQRGGTIKVGQVNATNAQPTLVSLSLISSQIPSLIGRDSSAIWSVFV